MWLILHFADLCIAELQKLDISGNAITSVRQLEKLKHLRSVDMGGNQLSSLEGLEELPELQHIDVNHNRLETLEALARLRRLDGLMRLNVTGNALNQVSSSLTLFLFYRPAYCFQGFLNLRQHSLAGNYAAIPSYCPDVVPKTCLIHAVLTCPDVLSRTQSTAFGWSCLGEAVTAAHSPPAATSGGHQR